VRTFCKHIIGYDIQYIRSLSPFSSLSSPFSPFPFLSLVYENKTPAAQAQVSTPGRHSAISVLSCPVMSCLILFTIAGPKIAPNLLGNMWISKLS